MAIRIPTVQLNNERTMPIMGLGTWKSTVEDVTEAVKHAIACGYRHIDCASIYGNEKEIGLAIEAKIADGTVERDDLFITSKLWSNNYRKELVGPALQRTLNDLKLEHLDMYLIHWPVGVKEGANKFPKIDPNTPAYSHCDFINVWTGMQFCALQELTNSIGLSNFNKRQIQRIIDVTQIMPATNQVECHPYLTQKKLINFCREKGIVVTAYSPLGSPDRPDMLVKDNDPVLLDDPVVKEIAQKYDKNPGQILLRYQIQNGTVVIPKSVTAANIESNLEVFKFELSDEDHQKLENLNRNWRYITFDLINSHPEYPFKDEY